MQEYYVDNAIIYFSATRGVLAFAPVQPAWGWINKDSKVAIEALIKGKSPVQFAQEVAVTEGVPFKRALSDLISFYESCPFITDKPVQEKTQRCRGFAKLNQVWLCPSGTCNLKCLYCAVDASSKRQSTESLDFWISVVKQSLDLGAESFVLSGGEPSLYPGFIDLVEWIDKNTEAKILILTNATIIDDEKATRLSRTRTSVQISLDGISPATHDKIRGKNNFHKSLATFQKLKKLHLQPQLSMTICRINSGDIEQMPDFAKQLGCDNVRMAPFFDIGRGCFMEKDGFSVEEKIALVKRILSLRRRKRIDVSCSMGAFEDIKMNAKQDQCGAAHGIIGINYDGGVYPCTDGFQMPHLCGGNLKKISLKSIMQGEIFSRVRGSSLLDYVSCKKCHIRYICGGGCLMERLYARHKGLSMEHICDYRKEVLKAIITEEV